MPKPFLSYDQQIQKLKDKLLMIPDEDYATEMLRRYGYFALVSGYKHLLKNPSTKNYQDGTTFQDIVSVYLFDEQLRELTFRYLLHIERHIRSAISYGFCSVYGESQTAYLTAQNYDISTRRKQSEVSKLISRYLNPLVSRPSQYDYIEHYKQKHHNVPLWAAVNTMTFGSLSKMYAYSKPRIQSSVSKEFEGINEAQLRQLLEVLTNFRNVCAHNERLFTHQCAKHDIPDLPLHRKLGIPQNGQMYLYGKRDYFAVVLAFRYLLPHKEFLVFKRHLSALLDRFAAANQKIPLHSLQDMMGMPENWKKLTAYKKV